MFVYDYRFSRAFQQEQTMGSYLFFLCDVLMMYNGQNICGMDIDIIESTFNELMAELGKLKDLNETAESYKQRTHLLCEQLEQFLSVAKEGRSAILKDAENIKTLIIETGNKNADHISGVGTSMSNAISENKLLLTENQRNNSEEFERLISLSMQAKELVEQLNVFSKEMQLKNERNNGVIVDKFSELEQLNKSRFEQNEGKLKKIQVMCYVHLGLTIVLFLMLVMMIIFR